MNFELREINVQNQKQTGRKQKKVTNKMPNAN